MSGASKNLSGTTRRTSSSPYLGNPPTRNNKSQNRTRQGPPATSSNLNDSGPSRAVPPRGSRSAPPHFQKSVDPPDIHDYYERRAGAQKEVKRKLLKSRLDRLLDYQSMISQEIDDLEKDFEIAMRTPPPMPRNYNRRPSEPTAPKPKLKQFRVVGGCPGNLSYKINKKAGRDGKVRAFSLAVDVKGYVTDKVEVDTEDTTMTIKATKMNGSKKDLKVVAPTVKDMEKAYIHTPKLGLLVIDF